MEKELIQQVLRVCQGTQTKTASRLGINRNTLHKKIEEYGLESERAERLSERAPLRILQEYSPWTESRSLKAVLLRLVQFIGTDFCGVDSASWVNSITIRSSTWTDFRSFARRDSLLGQGVGLIGVAERSIIPDNTPPLQVGPFAAARFQGRSAPSFRSHRD